MTKPDGGSTRSNGKERMAPVIPKKGDKATTWTLDEGEYEMIAGADTFPDTPPEDDYPPTANKLPGVVLTLLKAYLCSLTVNCAKGHH